MCGICGQLMRSRDRPVRRDVLERMNAAMRHRGPDSEGYYVKGRAGLAMRRLAIIDLETGDQPIANEDGAVWVVLNGEIYNFASLRADLEKRGHVFRTRSDTEVIVHAYEEHGPECVTYLRGMFAFAVWDENREKLFIARDRLGQKPLYYAEHDGGFLFGSELKCILQHPGISRDVDLEAVHHYLTLQYVPEPSTGLSAVRKLPPAHRLVWHDGEVACERYWDLPYEPKWSGSRRELDEKVLDVVSEAVRVRLISDVPLGAHLSGGIDSSIIVGLMAEMSENPVKTFSIGYKEQAFSETAFARQVADMFATEHHEFVVEPDALAILPELVSHFGEPHADPAAIPTWYLAAMTREHVTVALNGDGGDEAFAGYQRYYADVLADLYRALPLFFRKRVMDHILSTQPVQMDRPVERSHAMAIRRLAQAADLSHAASIVRWGGYFSERQKQSIYTDEMKEAQGPATASLLEKTFFAARARGRVDRTLYTDVHNYLPGALLPKVDRMTMAHSLEARSPFLDHRVMEIAARLPVSCKVRGAQTKRVLRRVFGNRMPNQIRRRGKAGFNVPLGMWFRGPHYESAVERLVKNRARVHRFLRPDRLQAMLTDHRAGRDDHGKRIWAVLVLEEWLELMR